MPMQMVIGLAELKALGVCPCRILLVWQKRKHSECAYATFTVQCLGLMAGIVWGPAGGTRKLGSRGEPEEGQAGGG